jgi:hypothetical protein
MITKSNRGPNRVDITAKLRPVVGLPDGVERWRLRLRRNSLPRIYLKFKDRIQEHILLLSGENYEPYEHPDAINQTKEVK